MGGGGSTTAPYQAPVATAVARSITRNEGNVETSGIARRRKATGLNDTFMRAFTDSTANKNKTTLGG
jgi:hypothetical protein